MAKNTKGDGSLEQNGVTTVTPDNIGKGLVWNAQTKQYDVNVADSHSLTVNEHNIIGLRLSPDEGNLLEIRDNGVGLWQVIEPDLRRQYVDSVNGNDGNAGTKASPLKTFEHALSRLYNSKNGGRGTAAILIKNGGTYYVGHERFSLTDLNLAVINYGDELDGDVHIGDGYYVCQTKSYVKPKLISKWDSYPYDTLEGKKQGVMSQCLYLRRFVGNGIEIVLEQGVRSIPTGTSHFALLERDMVLRGCDVKIHSGILARMTQLFSTFTHYEMDNSTYLTDQYNSVYFQSGGDRAEQTIHIAGKDWITNQSDLEKVSVARYGLKYDASTKRQLGWSSNYDVFK